jgi:lipopolysaccharide export system permease protein
MIGTLDRYVAGRALKSIALSLFGLVTIFSLIRFGQELRDVGTGAYGVLAATRFVLHTIPAEAFRLLTPAVLVGTAHAIGDLATHNETVALAACGVSRLRLLGAVLQVVVGIGAVGLAVGDLVAAPLAQRARSDRAVALSAGRALATPSGLWARDGERFVNIRRAPNPRRLEGIYVYEFDQGRRLETFLHAESAVWRDGRWTLRNVLEGQVGPDGVETHRDAERTWATTLVPRQVAMLQSPVEELSTLDLLSAVDALGHRGESDRRHRAALWSRLAVPLEGVAMAILAVAFFSRPQGRSRPGPRIVAAVLAGIGFQLADEMFARLALLWGAPAFAASLALPGIALVAGLVWFTPWPIWNSRSPAPVL